MPLKRLHNPTFCNFPKKYCTNQNIPDESILRRNYIVDVYKDVLEKVRIEIEEYLIWISADETTNLYGCHSAF